MLVGSLNALRAQGHEINSKRPEEYRLLKSLWKLYLKKPSNRPDSSSLHKHYKDNLM